jgi:TRAP-type C4-dicarboxylate transport system substrate-binding protein
MIKACARWALFALALLPSGVSAEPIKLKLSLITSDRSLIYQAAVKPFVDVINAEAKGLLEIEVYFSGTLGKVAAEQPQLVADDLADIAFIIPGYTPERFYDDSIIELPGLYHDMREGSLVYTRLIAAGALRGYKEFFVIAALMSPPESIHSRQPIATIADLKGTNVRTNNLTETAALEKLGMHPVKMPMNLISGALSSGEIDSATVPPAMLFEYGIGRVASYHYLLDIGAAPLALVMNRKKFDSLPQPAQDIIRKYSGEWPVARYLEADEAVSNQIMDQLTSNPRRKVIYPSQSDLDTAQLAFKSVIDEWVAKSSRNRELFEIAEKEIAKYRATR